VISLKDGRDQIDRERDLQFQIGKLSPADFRQRQDLDLDFFQAPDRAANGVSLSAGTLIRKLRRMFGAKADGLPGVIA